MKTNLNEVRDVVGQISAIKGFTEQTVLESMALIHSEVSEAVEDYRSGLSPADFVYDTDKSLTVGTGASIDKPCGIPSEMADIIIRTLDFCYRHGIDIERAISEKIRYNSLRPYKHGKII